MNWPEELRRIERESEVEWDDRIIHLVTREAEILYTATFFRGPEDEPDPAVNGDPDSLNGEEDEAGYSAGEGDGYEEFLDEDDEGDEDDEEADC